VIVRFVENGLIDDHHCLNFLFITSLSRKLFENIQHGVLCFCFAFLHHAASFSGVFFFYRPFGFFYRLLKMSGLN
jgi:hypothetical protein